MTLKTFQNPDPSKPEKDAEFYKKVKSDYRWSVFAQSALITLGTIFIFGGIGWFIDDWMDKDRHTFFITLLIISYPITQFLLYKKVKDLKLPKNNE